MIRLEGIVKSFPPDRQVLSRINLTVEKAEWVWLLGETGIGKSVLMKIVYGALTPDEGTVTVLDEDIPSLKEKKLAGLRKRLGIVFQDIKLFDNRTALANIVLILQALGTKKADATDKASYWLEKVGMMEMADRKTYELSVGQRQKIALARALAKEPELLLLDEPFSALDENQKKKMLKILGEVNHRGTTILAVSHENEVLSFLPGRVLQFNQEGLL
jgi:cell division transport system ATP-binding protein